jgi:hypothetical protein
MAADIEQFFGDPIDDRRGRDYGLLALSPERDREKKRRHSCSIHSKPMLASLPEESRMDWLEGIKIFVRVVDSGSFSAVARELATGQPVISKQVAALEEHLGAQLLMRTSRSLSLTETGRDFYESAVRLISELEAAES